MGAVDSRGKSQIPERSENTASRHGAEAYKAHPLAIHQRARRIVSVSLMISQDHPMVRF